MTGPVEAKIALVRLYPSGNLSVYTEARGVWGHAPLNLMLHNVSEAIFEA